MKARFLGSTFTTILVRCPCGWKLYFDRGEWARLNFLACDNCRAIILYNSLRVVPTELGGGCMGEYEETPERRAVIAELEQALAHLEQASTLISNMGLAERAHKMRNCAQQASDMTFLLAFDWHDADEEARAGASQT